MFDCPIPWKFPRPPAFFSSRWMVNVAGQSFGVRNDASHDDAYAPVDRRSWFSWFDGSWRMGEVATELAVLNKKSDSLFFFWSKIGMMRNWLWRKLYELVHHQLKKDSFWDWTREFPSTSGCRKHRHVTSVWLNIGGTQLCHRGPVPISRWCKNI